jgi:hypothetical protein
VIRNISFANPKKGRLKNGCLFCVAGIMAMKTQGVIIRKDWSLEKMECKGGLRKLYKNRHRLYSIFS